MAREYIFLYGTKFEVATFLPGPKVCGAVLTVVKEHLHKLFCCLFAVER